MTRIKLCGLSRPCDIEAANDLKPDYIGFVFCSKSKRYVTPEKAAELKEMLNSGIKAVGVFVDGEPEMIARLLKDRIIDVAQLHGREDRQYIQQLRKLADEPIIQAVRVTCTEDVRKAENSPADFLLFDSGAGTGTVFNWELLQNVQRPYFLAGGLNCENVSQAIKALHPYAVDVSSGIETGERKDKEKMAVFTAAVRKEDKL